MRRQTTLSGDFAVVEERDPAIVGGVERGFLFLFLL